ncbi:MAG: hypothetical protein A2Z31_04155 [candidate division NC10 bacterium RBG_16_65_8]|nr:MAG: hypothetical protein A2Z31_04155 [candidate division NC10 bacterium RBG_16_65_8]
MAAEFSFRAVKHYAPGIPFKIHGTGDAGETGWERYLRLAGDATVRPRDAEARRVAPPDVSPDCAVSASEIVRATVAALRQKAPTLSYAAALRQALDADPGLKRAYAEGATWVTSESDAPKDGLEAAARRREAGVELTRRAKGRAAMDNVPFADALRAETAADPGLCTRYLGRV